MFAQADDELMLVAALEAVSGHELSCERAWCCPHGDTSADGVAGCGCRDEAKAELMSRVGSLVAE